MWNVYEYQPAAAVRLHGVHLRRLNAEKQARKMSAGWPAGSPRALSRFVVKYNLPDAPEAAAYVGGVKQ